MRYIKFRALSNKGVQKVELVRVSENGKIISKGYGPLNLQVLDHNVKDQGTKITPPDILCFGAKPTLHEVSIQGKVDVYMDDSPTPVLTNVSEADIANMTSIDPRGFIEIYKAEDVVATTDWELLIPAPILSSSVFPITIGMVVGVKYKDQPNVVYKSTTMPIYDTDDTRLKLEDYNGIRREFVPGLTKWLKIAFGGDFTVDVSTELYVPSEVPWNDFYHKAYISKIYPKLLNSTARNPAKNYSGNIRLKSVSLSFTLPSNVEYLVIPTLEKPYGDNYIEDTYFITILNNLMKHENVVYYADGTKAFDVQGIPSMVTEDYDSYPPANVPSTSLIFIQPRTPTVIDLTNASVVMDYVTMTAGRYFDLRPEYLSGGYINVRYKTAHQPVDAAVGGIHLMSAALYGIASSSWSAMGWIEGGKTVFDPHASDYTLDSEGYWGFIISWMIPDATLRIKVPEDVTSVEFSYNL